MGSRGVKGAGPGRAVCQGPGCASAALLGPESHRCHPCRGGASQSAGAMSSEFPSEVCGLVQGDTEHCHPYPRILELISSWGGV